MKIEIIYWAAQEKAVITKSKPGPKPGEWVVVSQGTCKFTKGRMAAYVSRQLTTGSNSEVSITTK